MLRAILQFLFLSLSSAMGEPDVGQTGRIDVCGDPDVPTGGC
jgi:hypothetical protein